MKLKFTFFELLRCAPLLYELIFLNMYFIQNDSIYIKFILIKTINVFLNKIFKEISRKIFKCFGTSKNNVDYLPFLGRGHRPDGAKNCGIFNECTNKLSKSYGFPSGHAQSAACIFVLMSLLVKNKYHKLFIFLFTIMISFARIYENCHTIQQVISGYTIGYFITKKLLTYHIF